MVLRAPLLLCITLGTLAATATAQPSYSTSGYGSYGSYAAQPSYGASGYGSYASYAAQPSYSASGYGSYGGYAAQPSYSASGYGSYGSYGHYGSEGSYAYSPLYAAPPPGGVLDCICTFIYKPVCVNGVQHTNECQAECHGAKMWQEGPCETIAPAPAPAFDASLPGRRLQEQDPLFTALFGAYGKYGSSYWTYGSPPAYTPGQYSAPAPAIPPAAYGLPTPSGTAPACPCSFVYDPVCSVAGVQFSNSCEAECAGLTPADFSRRMLPTDYTPGPCTASATGLGGANPNLSDPGRRHLRENAALLSDAELAALLGISGFASQPVDTVTPLSPSPISSIGAGSGAGLVASPVVGTSPPADAAPLPAAPALGGYTAQRNLAGAYAYGYGGSAAPSPVGAYNAKQCNCAFIFAPVCASSGVQYANACTALCDGLQPSDWSEGPCAKASVSPTQTITGASRKAGQQVPGRRLLQKTTAAKPAAAKNNTAVPNVDPVLGVSVLIPANNTAIAFSPSSGISIQTAPVDDGGFVSAPKRNASGPSRAPSIAPAPAKVAPAIIPSFQAAARSASAPAPAPALAIMSQQPIDLGTASAFVVLGAATVTNTGPSAITGDLGVSPGTAITGLPPGIMTNGTIQAGSGKAAAAHADATSAYNQAAGRTVGSASVSGNLGGMTLPPGLYTSTAGFAVSSGDLTLDGQGSTSSVFVFQMATTLVMSAGRRIVLTNGASAQNIFWQVGSSATFGVGSVAVGNVLAYASITMTTGARVTGRLLALTGAVTLDSNTVVKPAAVPVAPAAAPAPTKVGGASTESFPGAAAIPVPIPSTPFITPLGVVGGPGGYGGFQSPSLPGRYGSPSLGSYGGSGSYAPAPVPGYGYGGGYGLGAYGSGYYLSSEYLDMLRRRRQPTPAPAPAPAADPPKLFAPGPVPAVAGFGANAAAVVSGQMLICAAQPTVDYINAPVINAADLEFAIQAHFVETAANALAVGASDIRAAQFRKEGVSGCLVPPTNFGGFEFPTEPQACCCASPDSVFVKPFEVVAGSAQEANTMVTTLGLASLSGTFADSFSQFDQLDGRVCASLLAPPSVTLNPGANGRKLFADDAAVVPQRGRWAHSSLGRRLKDV